MLTESIRVGGIPLTVEVAVHPEDQSKGLSGRTYMNWNRGMIFLYPQEEIRGFWMRNTPLALSIAFFDAAGVIVHIADMHPGSEQWVMSPVPCRGAIEVNQGWFAKNRINVGDVVDLGRPQVPVIMNPETEVATEPTTDWLAKAKTGYAIAHMISAPVAMGLSYQRNRSILWAVLTGFVPIPYLVYRAADRGSRNED